MIYNYMKYNIYILLYISPNAIAIGVLTSNRRGGRRTTLADWTWHQGAIAGCHCSVLWLGASVMTNFGGVDVVPLLGAHGTSRSNGIQKSIQKNCLELRSDVTLFWTLITQTLVFAIWGLCWYIFFIFACKNKTCISIVRGLLLERFYSNGPGIQTTSAVAQRSLASGHRFFIKVIPPCLAWLTHTHTHWWFFLWGNCDLRMIVYMFFSCFRCRKTRCSSHEVIFAHTPLVSHLGPII